jgi:putative phosphoribosyl transferase
MNVQRSEPTIDLPAVSLPGILALPDEAIGIVVFAHGSGSSRLSPRNATVADYLNATGLATLLFDLLTPAESLDRANVFDIDLLGGRLDFVCRWLEQQAETRDLAIGLFGASTGAAAALVAAAAEPQLVAGVVSRGGRADLAGKALPGVHAPTLLIVGSLDTVVLDLNRQALTAMHGEHELVVVPGATHLFEEPGTLDQVSTLAARWFVDQFVDHLG